VRDYPVDASSSHDYSCYNFTLLLAVRYSLLPLKVSFSVDGKDFDSLQSVVDDEKPERWF